MIVFKSKKFTLGEKSTPLKPEEEILGLNILLELVLAREEYEPASLIKSRLDKIELERISKG